MRRSLALALAAGAVAAAPAPAPAASVSVMVVGKEGVLRDARDVTLRSASVRVGGRRCRVAARTPLAVLARTRLRLRLRDYGSCGRATRDAGGLFVTAIGSERNRGQDGWVYKAGRRAGSVSAGDAGSPLGRRILWFWCRQAAGGCQRTLDVRPERTRAAAGDALRVRVTAYDDNGRGVPAAGAVVRMGAASAVADRAGDAVLTVPAGARSVHAEHPDMVRSFPVAVRAG